MNFKDYYLLENEDKINTIEFKRWFGNSKIVDSSGNPLIVYHGTGNKFHTFDYSKVGNNGRSEGQGFYFTTDKDTAQGYKRDDGDLLEVYISIQKPLDFNAKSFSKIELKKLINAIIKEQAKNGISTRDGFLSNYGDIEYEGLNKVINEIINSIVEDSALDQMGGIVGSGVGVEELNKAVTTSLGYDGIISHGFGGYGKTGGEIIIPFHPNQIKSATNNNGKFDINSNNIYESKS